MVSASWHRFDSHRFAISAHVIFGRDLARINLHQQSRRVILRNDSLGKDLVDLGGVVDMSIFC